MEAGIVPLAAGCIAGMLTLLLLHKWLEKNRGEGFSWKEPKLTYAGFVFAMGICMFALVFVGFATREIDTIGIVLGCIVGFALAFIGTFDIGMHLPSHAALSQRALMAFAGFLYLGIAAIGIISGAAPQGNGPTSFVSIKSDFLLWLALVLAAVVGGISYIYDAVKKRQG